MATTAVNQADAYQSEYGITRQFMPRHKGHREWCWRIGLSRQDQRVIRIFYDIDYNSPEDGLTAARAYRDAFIAAFPPVTNLQRAQKIRSSNKSGIPGVYRVATTTGAAQWRASVAVDGREHSRCFSIAEYGEEKAKELAVIERQKLLQKFVPNFLRVPAQVQEQAEEQFPEYLSVIPDPKSGKWMDDETFKRKLAEIDAQFAPGQTRARRLYINASLGKSGKVLSVFVSNWQQKENFKRGFGLSSDISGPLGKARTFIMETITAIHGPNAAKSFMEDHGDQLQPEVFSTRGKFRERFIESRDAKTGNMIWRRVV